MPTQHVGALVRDWRVRRRRSQMDLALDVGVSPRHLSFVETGRSRPSPELLSALADELAVPPREQNVMLLAAGYAPRHSETPLSAPAMAQVQQALQRLLDSHDPYPGIVVDRHWNVVMSNNAGNLLGAALPAGLLGPPMNVFRACLHPAGLARITLNFPEWSAYLLGELHRAVTLSADPALDALAAEVATYPNLPRPRDWRRGDSSAPQLLIPWQLDLGGRALSLITTMTTFGTPQDVTLSELAVELFFPADEASAALLRSTA